MVARIFTVAFAGIEAVEVETQVTIQPGLPAFALVGLGDRAVAESKERVRAALSAIGLALPARRITVNLGPADLLKEGAATCRQGAISQGRDSHHFNAL
jgi:magnesium chelatase family protein